MILMHKVLDIRQLQCPRSFVEVKLAIKQLSGGQELKVIGSNEQLYQDLQKIRNQWDLQLTFDGSSITIITRS